ncbi:MAG: FAD-binding oxidoreductase [Candidatus Hodarchaeota archaeon]
MKLYEEIENIVGTKYVSDSKPICYSYSMNCDTVLQGIPDLVVQPRTAIEVSEILKVANKHGEKVIPRGGGADLTGGAKPIGDGGIVLDLTRMNKILDVDEKNLIVTVEVGISWSELCEQLSKVGAGYYTGSTGPASGFSATVGGGLSNNTVGGGGAAMYGAVTEQCVGLEVVLPTGEMIFTGSKANSFCEKQFTRFGLGPDYSGLFLGDVGIHGVKTKASLHLYPIPEYTAYNTYEINDTEQVSEAVRVMNVIEKWQGKQLPLHDFYYYTKGYTKLLTMFQIKKNLAKAGVNGSVMFYTTVADSQRQLELNVERIEKIAKDAELKELGSTIEEGNLAKWFIEEDGRWQWAHIYWGLYGPEGTSLGTCLKCPTYQLPDYIKLYENWANRNTNKMREIGGGGANFIVIGVHPSYIDVTGGISVHSDPKFRDIQHEMWKDLIIAQIKELGGIHYWMGEIIGRSLVDAGALTKEYYDFMISIKKALDPNGILSPGKFYLVDNYRGDGN